MIGSHAVVLKGCAKYVHHYLRLGQGEEGNLFRTILGQLFPGVLQVRQGCFFFIIVLTALSYSTQSPYVVFLARTKPVVHVDGSTQGRPRYMVNILPERQPEYERQWGLVGR
jgi:hypothetical protein